MMVWKPGTWLEPKQYSSGSYGARHPTNKILYLLNYNGWGINTPDSYDIIHLRVEGGMYKGGSMEHMHLKEDDWEKVERPPFADRQAVKAVFT